VDKLYDMKGLHIRSKNLLFCSYNIGLETLPYYAYTLALKTVKSSPGGIKATFINRIKLIFNKKLRSF
jgi:hypothetical protein